MRKYQYRNFLSLPIESRLPGLYIYCNGCKKYYNNDTVIKCSCGKLTYKAKIHVPGTDKACRTKNIESGDIKKALAIFIKFRNSVINTAYENMKNVLLKPELNGQTVDQFLRTLGIEISESTDNQPMTNIRLSVNRIFYGFKNVRDLVQMALFLTDNGTIFECDDRSKGAQYQYHISISTN